MFLILIKINERNRIGLALAIKLATDFLASCCCTSCHLLFLHHLGTDLNVCRATGDQCCAQQFLDRIGRDVRTAALRGLQDEVGNRMTEVQNILDRLATCK